MAFDCVIIARERAESLRQEAQACLELAKRGELPDTTLIPFLDSTSTLLGQALEDME